MNRRGFIGTITALAGVVLANIKAPAAPKYVAGLDAALPGTDHLLVHYTGKFKFGDIRRIVYNPDGLPIGIVLKPEAQRLLDNP